MTWNVLAHQGYVGVTPNFRWNGQAANAVLPQRMVPARRSPRR